jgi:hypothetical protein
MPTGLLGVLLVSSDASHRITSWHPLSAVCCLQSAVCCLLSGVCYLLSAGCCLLSAVCCLLLLVCSLILLTSFFYSLPQFATICLPMNMVVAFLSSVLKPCHIGQRRVSSAPISHTHFF